VHGHPVTLHLERLWTRDVTITTGLVDTFSTPTLLRLLTSGQIDAKRFVTASDQPHTGGWPASL
jgi:alcohol dehydrogenase